MRFQAEHSNDCWQFDLSPSDLKHIYKPEWIDPARGEPTLMLFSVVDDRSGVAYQEYHCVYGEDAESALRFLFSAMAPKADPTYPFQGRPKMIYLDNGPVATLANSTASEPVPGGRISAMAPSPCSQRWTIFKDA